MSPDDIKQGDRPTALRALRDYLVESLKVAETGQVAAISKQLQALLAELEQIDAPAEESLTDDLAQRRADRLARRARFFEIGLFPPERSGTFFSPIDVPNHNSNTVDRLAPFLPSTGNEMYLVRDRCGAVGVSVRGLAYGVRLAV